MDTSSTVAPAAARASAASAHSAGHVGVGPVDQLRCRAHPQPLDPGARATRRSTARGGSASEVLSHGSWPAMTS